ncbi:hypothetical protein [Thermincola potens]|uniref:hypothetical protein n=1 Tax=Thermincola potens TaxID=863643 RepID=UPI0018DF12F8|nr:hypothetical protein [Thermincola potens]
MAEISFNTDIYFGQNPKCCRHIIWALTKYPLSEEIFLKCFGKEKFESAKTIWPAFKHVEEPDLLIYKPDFSEIRFAESKRLDTRDKLREKQARGLALLSILLGCQVDVFEVVEEGKVYKPQPIIWKS